MQIVLNVNPDHPLDQQLLNQIAAKAQSAPRRSNNPIDALVNFGISRLHQGIQYLVDWVATALQQWWSRGKR